MYALMLACWHAGWHVASCLILSPLYTLESRLRIWGLCLLD